MARPGAISWPDMLRAAVPAEVAVAKTIIAPWWLGRRLISSISPWGERRDWRRAVLMVSGMLKRAMVRAARSGLMVVVVEVDAKGGEPASSSLAGAGEAESWVSLFCMIVVVDLFVGFGSAMLTDKIRALNLVSLRIKDASASSCTILSVIASCW